MTSSNTVEGFNVVTLRAEDHRPSFASSTHRVIIQSENERQFIGWPERWLFDNYRAQFERGGLDAIGKPLEYPKFAWEMATDSIAA